MTGRGIDQILPQSVAPLLHEPSVRDARVYVNLAEEENGAVDAPVDYAYIWGDALEVLERMAPDASIMNLETSVTTSDAHWPGKAVHYRMHPENISCITAAHIDCCVLANNHVLDWGYAGLQETLKTLKHAGIQHAGAGEDIQEAAAPAVLEADGRRILVFSIGSPTSGVPRRWAAGDEQAGVHLIEELSEESAQTFAAQVRALQRPGDIVIVSIHWGGNWGFLIPPEQKAFAHALIDAGGADVVHGHSSHHVKGIEIYKDRPIFYGCGDFLNDYEGISGHEQFRPELTLMYFPRIDPETGQLAELVLVPMRIENLQVQRASASETEWLRDTLNREGRQLGTRVKLRDNGRLELRWE